MTGHASSGLVTWEASIAQDAATVFGPNWDCLVEQSPHATAFQAAAWHRAWIESVAAAEGQTPVVITVYQGLTLVAGLALQFGSQDGRAVISPLTAPWADYHDAVGQLTEPGVRSALLAGLARVAADLSAEIELTELISDGLLHRALPVGLARLQGTPVLGIDLDNQEHVRRVQAVKEYATKLRRLSKLAEVSCQHYDQPTEIDARFGRLVDLHREQWADRSDVVAPFDQQIESGFRAMIRHMAPAGQVVFTEFLAGEEVIACYFGLRWKDWYGAYRTSYDSRYRRYSPGHLMLRAMMADFAAAGVRCLDLTRGAYAYKLGYASRLGCNTAVRCRPADLLATTRLSTAVGPTR